eukprot:scaffold396_cov339-Prasinococcus_capsulatus_cf.AAC.12
MTPGPLWADKENAAPPPVMAKEVHFHALETLFRESLCGDQARMAAATRSLTSAEHTPGFGFALLQLCLPEQSEFGMSAAACFKVRVATSQMVLLVVPRARLNTFVSPDMQNFVTRNWIKSAAAESTRNEQRAIRRTLLEVIAKADTSLVPLLGEAVRTHA